MALYSEAEVTGDEVEREVEAEEEEEEVEGDEQGSLGSD